MIINFGTINTESLIDFEVEYYDEKGEKAVTSVKAVDEEVARYCFVKFYPQFSGNIIAVTGKK